MGSGASSFTEDTMLPTVLVILAIAALVAYLIRSLR